MLKACGVNISPLLLSDNGWILVNGSGNFVSIPFQNFLDVAPSFQSMCNWYRSDFCCRLILGSSVSLLTLTEDYPSTLMRLFRYSEARGRMKCHLTFLQLLIMHTKTCWLIMTTSLSLSRKFINLMHKNQTSCISLYETRHLVEFISQNRNSFYKISVSCFRKYCFNFIEKNSPDSIISKFCDKTSEDVLLNDTILSLGNKFDPIKLKTKRESCDTNWCEAAWISRKVISTIGFSNLHIPLLN